MKTQKPLIKVCGMRDAENIRSVEASGVDLIGMIFFPNSPRFVDTMPSYMPQKEKRVGVFVNADTDEMLRTADKYQLSTLHKQGRHLILHIS